MSVILGGNDFFGVPFPLVLADRFFHIYSTTSGLKIDIFRWDETGKQPTYEVKGSKPLADNITTNPTGIVTFSEPTAGTFLYKFRPKLGISQIFGRIPVNNEFDVKINDHLIEVEVNGKQICTLQRNQFTGMPIGIQVYADGSVGIGVNRLPAGMTLKRGRDK
jgi:hypothetical protein